MAIVFLIAAMGVGVFLIMFKKKKNVETVITEERQEG